MSTFPHTTELAVGPSIRSIEREVILSTINSEDLPSPLRLLLNLLQVVLALLCPGVVNAQGRGEHLQSRVVAVPCHVHLAGVHEEKPKGVAPLRGVDLRTLLAG